MRLLVIGDFGERAMERSKSSRNCFREVWYITFTMLISTMTKYRMLPRKATEIHPNHSYYTVCKCKRTRVILHIYIFIFLSGSTQNLINQTPVSFLPHNNKQKQKEKKEEKRQPQTFAKLINKVTYLDAINTFWIQTFLSFIQRFPAPIRQQGTV